MTDQSPATVISSKSPAKINLTLRILGKRPDGFHDLESLMMRISLYDTIYLAPSTQNAITLSVDDRRHDTTDTIPVDDKNLVVQALEALRTQTKITNGAAVRLIKKIPSQAGLGGGSSNAAIALRLANEAWRLGLSLRELKEIGAKLGSDIAFFLSDSPSLCTGRGEETVAANFSNFYLVVIHPPTGLATSSVYNRYSQIQVAQRQIASLNNHLCLHRLGSSICNDLQPAACSLTPWIARLTNAFNRESVIAHQMSGSGTAYFGICRNARHASVVASRLRQRGLGDVFALRSLTERATDWRPVQAPERQRQ